MLVADRENQRVQTFTLDGAFVEQWHCHRAVAVESFPKWPVKGEGAAPAEPPIIVVAEQGSTSRVQHGDGFNALPTWTKNIGHRITFHNGATGERESKIGGETPGERPDQFNWLHSIAVNSLGDVYAAEVSFCECGKNQLPLVREMVSLRKWRKKA